MKSFFGRLLAIAALAFAVALPAQAGPVFSWDWTFTSSGMTVGHGTITTANNARLPEAVLSITGMFEGHTITGLLASDPLLPPGDNKFSIHSPFLSGDGWLFDASGFHYNLFEDAGTWVAASFERGIPHFVFGTFNAVEGGAVDPGPGGGGTPSVPEPASLALVGLALVPLAATQRKRSRKLS